MESLKRILIVLAVLITLALPAIPLPVVAISTYGAGAYPDAVTVGPIGGGVGYTNYYSAAGAYAVCTSQAELTAALTGATSGDVIWIPNGTTITITGAYSKTLRAGAILASDRGLLGVAGGKIVWTYAATSYMTPLFWAESRAIFSGLTLEGPNGLASTTGPRNCAIRASAVARVEVENCEISEFPEAGIWFGDSGGAISAWDSDDPNTGRHWVHHCYIHNIQKHGFGYGIGEQGSGNSFLAEANILGPCRHSIMGQAGSDSYEVRYNIFYDSYYNTNSSGTGTWYNSTQVDCHGTGATPSPSAGVHLIIHHNTFSTNDSYTTKPNVGIRGIPAVECQIYNNWTQKTTHAGLYTETASSNSAFTLESSSGGTWDGGPLLSTYNMAVYDNWYGNYDSPDEPETPPVPPTLHVTTLSVLGINGSSALLRGSVSGFDPATQYPQNAAFVWDTNSWDDPGNTSPDMTDYTSTGDYWDSATAYMDNATIGHRIGGLAPGATYYYRLGVDWAYPGDWEYGEEMEFTTDDDGCILYDYINEDDGDGGVNLIGVTITQEGLGFCVPNRVSYDGEDVYIPVGIIYVTYADEVILSVDNGWLEAPNLVVVTLDGATIAQGDYDWGSWWIGEGATFTIDSVTESHDIVFTFSVDGGCIS